MSLPLKYDCDTFFKPLNRFAFQDYCAVAMSEDQDLGELISPVPQCQAKPEDAGGRVQHELLLLDQIQLKARCSTYLTT